MQAFESIPLFRTRPTAGDGVAAKEAAQSFTITFDAPTDPAPIDNDRPLAPLPPMRMVSTRPPLPAEMWLSGLSPAEAMAAWQRLRAEWFCTCGAAPDGWYVRCDSKHYTMVPAGNTEKC